MQQWKDAVTSTNDVIISKRSAKLSLKQALESCQLNIAEQELGRSFLSILFVKAINEVSVMSGSQMSADAKVMLSDSIMNQFWYLKVDEVLLVLRNGLNNQYGLNNKNLNAQIILDWFNRHEQDRDELFYNTHLELKNSSGNQSDRSPEPRLAKDIFQESVDQKVQQRIDAYKRKVEENE